MYICAKNVFQQVTPSDLEGENSEASIEQLVDSKVSQSGKLARQRAEDRTMRRFVCNICHNRFKEVMFEKHVSNQDFLNRSISSA